MDVQTMFSAADLHHRFVANAKRFNTAFVDFEHAFKRLSQKESQSLKWFASSVLSLNYYGLHIFLFDLKIMPKHCFSTGSWTPFVSATDRGFFI